MAHYIFFPKNDIKSEDALAQAVETFAETFQGLRVLSYEFNAAVISTDEKTLDRLLEQNPAWGAVQGDRSFSTIHDPNDAFEDRSSIDLERKIASAKVQRKLDQ